MVFGRPHHFVSGQWKGKVLRFSLEAAQSPEVGRKSSVKDRRPITNIPIVRVRALEVDQATGVETEVDTETIDIADFVVSAELYSPVSSGPGSSAQPGGPSSLGASISAPSSALSPPERRSYFSVAQKAGQPSLVPAEGTESSGSTSVSGSSSGPGVTSGSASGAGTSSGSGSASAPPLSPSTRAERNILGNLATSAVRLNDLEGTPAIWFFYHDIAIRAEGDYSLRFQFVDLESRTEEYPEDAPILAECFSEPFTVHAPRNHPGVPPTTRLIKHFANQGYRLTVKKPTEESGYGGAAGGDDDDASDDNLPPVLVPGGTGGGLTEHERRIER